jgi:hypothetical protein
MEHLITDTPPSEFIAFQHSNADMEDIVQFFACLLYPMEIIESI